MSTNTPLPPPTGAPEPNLPPPAEEPYDPKAHPENDASPVNKKVVGLVGAGAFVLGALVGSVGDNGPKTISATAPTVTVTQTAPASAAAAPPVTETVQVTVTAKAPAPAPAPAPKASFPGDGVYQVGVDIKPGTYVTAKPDFNCYWARLSGNSGEFNDIIANANTAGQATVTIRKSDKFFETVGCSEWRAR